MFPVISSPPEGTQSLSTASPLTASAGRSPAGATSCSTGVPRRLTGAYGRAVRR